jgi:hypothetical protein
MTTGLLMSITSPRLIETPGQLAEILRELKAKVANNELQQDWPLNAPFMTPGNLQTIDVAGPWPDYIEMYFSTTQEPVMRFKLSVETYHGTGGTFQRLDSTDSASGQLR